MNHPVTNQPKIIGYICLFNDIPNKDENEFYLQIKYLKEKKGCHEVFCDVVKDSKNDDLTKRPNFETILDNIKPNDVLVVLKPEHDELVKIRFEEENENLPLIHAIKDIETLYTEICKGDMQ